MGPKIAKTSERRADERVGICMPIRLDSNSFSNKLAITRDASTTGMCVGTPTRLEVGQALEVTLRLNGGAGPQRTVTGRVLRVESNSATRNQLWRFVTAIEFDAVQPELGSLVAAEETPTGT
jgi:PilZ domain